MIRKRIGKREKGTKKKTWITHVEGRNLEPPRNVQPHVDDDRLEESVVARKASVSHACAGATALTFRLAMKLMDYNLMATITALLAPVLPDFKKAMKSEKAA